MKSTRAALSSEKYKLLSLTLKEAGLVRQERITRRPPGSPSPLSFAQQRLWFMDQLEPGNPQYNIPMGVRLCGPLNVEVLQRAVQEIVRRHEVLRTVFPTVGGEPAQVVLPEVDSILEVMDMTSMVREEHETRAHAITYKEWTRSFDLAHGPLIRVVVLRLVEDEHWLLLTTHHIIFDGWSVGLFVHELAELYEAFSSGKPSPLPELPIQYADFALWQRESVKGKVLQEQIDYWKGKIEGAPDILKLPTDRPRPAVQKFRGGYNSFAFSPELSKSLHALAGKERTTLFAVLMSAFQVLLYRYSGQDDMLVSFAIANRTRREIDSLIGCFINILLLRANLAGDPTFVDVLHRVHDAALEAHAHQDLPFEQLVAAVRPQRDLSYSPLAQVMMILNNTATSALSFQNISLSGIPAPETMAAQYDLLIFLSAEEDGGVIQGGFNYNSDLFDASTIGRMAKNLEILLRSAVEAPNASVASLCLMADEERQQVIVGNNQTQKEFPRNHCLHELFEKQAEQNPEAVAVIAGERRLQYGELNARANVMAERLRQSGVGAESIVAICLHRSVELVIGLMAILKAGAAYLPLDPDYPSDRLSFMLGDSGARVLLTQPQFLSCFSGHNLEAIFFEHDWQSTPDWSILNPRSGVTPDDLAYVIYTSGSTGRPKGAMLDHRGRVNNFFDFNDRFQIGAGDRLIALSSPSFDMCAYDVFGTLAAGASIVLPERGEDRDPKHWAELMIKHDVSIWHSVPALLELLVDACENSSKAIRMPALRVVLLGGDWIPVTLPDRIRKIGSGCQVVSLGGATEVSMDSTIYLIGETNPAWTSIPYGKPMTNQLAYVVDSRFEPVPIGVCGELCLGGVGVGRGYHRRPDLTAEKFIPHPFGQPGERIYRTGDLARWLPDGNLELVGRMDHQVKVRGFRIELGEIKTALERHPEVREAEVLMTGSHAAAKKLVAYIVPQDKDKAPAASEVQEFLRATLPAYMVPSAFVTLQALPLSPNGKIDRRALPAPEAAPVVITETVEPVTAAEAEIKRIWMDLLDAEEIGLDDDFFDLGGDSFKSITMLQKLPTRVSLVDFLKRPTIRNVAQCCSREQEQSSSLLLRLTKRPKKDAPVLLCVPYAGGSAIVFQPLAKALGDAMDLRAVMLPGHDLDQQKANLKSIEDVARMCVDEVKKWVKGPVYLYGHCGGSALTIELARLLELEKVDLKQVFMGAAYPYHFGPVARMLNGLANPFRSDDYWVRFIRELGGLGENNEIANIDFLAGAFKHDGACADGYFRKFSHGWPNGQRIAVPVLCLYADDDPLTPSYQTMFRRWEMFARSVEFVTLKAGGHYFVKGQADIVAQIVSAGIKLAKQAPAEQVLCAVGQD